LLLELAKPYFPAPHIRHAWIDDRVVILDLESEAYFALDPTASFMWRQLALGLERKIFDGRGPDRSRLCGIRAKLSRAGLVGR
jgi:hypothetical protein